MTRSRPLPSITRNCAVCGADDAALLHVEHVQPVVKCRRCGHIYCNPIPREEELFAYYDQSYDDWNEWERIFRHDRQHVFNEGLRRVRRIRPSGKLLDVGCSLGIFLEAARHAGYDCYGVEVSRPAADFARERLGLNVMHATLAAAVFPSGFFDVVTLWDVLEHVTDPADMVREIARVLRCDGLLVVRVPNANFHLFRHRIVSRALPSKDIGLDTINHINHFSPRTLSQLLTRHGFLPPIILPGAPNIYGKPAVDAAKHIYDWLARCAHCIFRLHVATIVEAYAIRVQK